MKDIVVETLKQIEQACERGDSITGIPTGLSDFDRRIGGIQRGSLTVIAGRPSMGKTALAREAAAWWLRTKRFDSAVFCSFEQKAGSDQVVQLIGKALEGESFSSRLADDQWATAVSLFHQRRVLVVWDNFESTLPIFQDGQTATDEEETPETSNSPLEFGTEERDRLRRLYRELTDGSPRGRLLVTCRPANTNLPGTSAP